MSASHRDSQGRPIVAVTGLGIVTSLGQGKEANWEALTAGRSGIHRIERFPLDPVDAELAIDLAFDEPRVEQHFELQRHRTERHVGHRVADGTRRQLLCPEQTQDLAAARRRESGQKRGIH